MIITPRVHQIGNRYKPLVLKQIEKNGCLYFRSLEPVTKNGVEVSYRYEDRAIREAYKAVRRERINILV